MVFLRNEYSHATIRRIAIGVFCMLVPQAVTASDDGSAPVLLWPDGVPGAVGETDQDRPALFVHRADKQNSVGTAVIVCPGGGYGALMMSYEGHEVAEWFNSFGVTAFVLRYRLCPRTVIQLHFTMFNEPFGMSGLTPTSMAWRRIVSA